MFGLQRLWAWLGHRLGRLAGGAIDLFFSGSQRADKQGGSQQPLAPVEPALSDEETAVAEVFPGEFLPDNEPEPSRQEALLEQQLRQVPPPEQVAQGGDWSTWAAELAQRITGQQEPAEEATLCGASGRQVLVWVPLRLISAVAVALLVVLGWGLWRLGGKFSAAPFPGRHPQQVARSQAVLSSEKLLLQDAMKEAAGWQGKGEVPWQGQVIPLPKASPRSFLAVSISGAGNSQAPAASSGKGPGRWTLSAGQQAVVQVRPWTSTQAWWQAMQRRRWTKGAEAGQDFLTAVVARGEAPGDASWLPWSSAAWHDRPRVWYEVGRDPLNPEARWLLVVVQAPAPAPRDDRPQNVIVVVAPSRQFRRSYSFLALSEELAHMATRARPADRLLVLGNGGELQLPLARLARRGAALEELQRLRSQEPDQMRRCLQHAIRTARRWSASRNTACGTCRLIVVTDLPWWTTTAREALAWARKWGEHLRRTGPVSLVRPGGPSPAGDGWPLVATLWRARRFRWQHAEHLRQMLWEASQGVWGSPVRLDLQVGWFGEEVCWLELPGRGETDPAARESLRSGLVPPGGLTAVMIRFGVSATGRESHDGSRRLLGWVQVRWQSGDRPVRRLRQPLGKPVPRTFHAGSPLFRAAWLSVHSAQLPPRLLTRPSLAPCWNDLAAPDSPRRWRQLVRLVEKGNAFD